MRAEALGTRERIEYGAGRMERNAVRVRFHWAENAKTLRTPGTGPGLGVVRKLVDMHGGRIAVHGTPGEVSVFSVGLQLEERWRGFESTKPARRATA